MKPNENLVPKEQDSKNLQDLIIVEIKPLPKA